MKTIFNLITGKLDKLRFSRLSSSRYGDRHALLCFLRFTSLRSTGPSRDCRRRGLSPFHQVILLAISILIYIFEYFRMFMTFLDSIVLLQMFITNQNT